MTHCNCCATGKRLRETNLKTPSTTWRRFEYEDWNSDKFWSIRQDWDGRTVWVRYGKNGTKGTLIKKNFDYYYEAEQFYSKMVTEKLGKGYEYMGTENHPV